MVPVSARAPGKHMRSVLLPVLIVVLAFALRLFYVLDAKVENPIAGDVNQYVLYAWNLMHSGTFSSSLPLEGNPIVPDGYRGPGYPLLLAAAMKLAGNAQLAVHVMPERLALIAKPATWISYTYLIQAVLGSLTVAITMAIASGWLGRMASIWAGLGVALWPHLVVFCGVLLSETLFGFTLLSAIGLLCVARERRSFIAAIGAGLAFGAVYLVNPVIALFPFIAFFVLARGQRLGLAFVFVTSYMIAPIGWGLHAANLSGSAPSALARAEQNFVQGSWPQYLKASTSRFSNDVSRSIIAAEEEEERILMADTASGLRLIWERMMLDPPYYLWWYLAQKPFLLWDWNIRVGWGDIYFYAGDNSAYERLVILNFSKRIFELLNPFFFALAAMAALALLIGLVHGRYKPPFAAVIIAIGASYLTLLHTILQAEPRYSIPYRSLQILLVAAAISWFFHVRPWQRIGV